MPCADRFENPARASMDLASLSAVAKFADARESPVLERMRTHLFAALVAALSTNVAAQDDNAITDMISNPILCVSAAHESSFMRFTTPTVARAIGRPPRAVRRRAPRAARREVRESIRVAGARRST